MEVLIKGFDSVRWRARAFYIKMTNLLPDIYLIVRKKKHVVINSWVDIRYGVLHHKNWGDDFNYYLVSFLTGTKPVAFSRTFMKVFHNETNYMLIGSVVHTVNENTIIWGSGVKFYDRPLRKIPKKICAVRGPITRQYFLKQGIDCPEVYGDPALLLPGIYKPKCKKVYSVGIIPHIWDTNYTIAKNYASFHNAIVINMAEFQTWEEIIDKICSCEVILSGSLHGLILADSYNIPNGWLKSVESDSYGDTKYKDYFLSVKRDEDYPLRIENEKDIEVAIATISEKWKPIDFDPSLLLASCPFPKIKKLYVR